jgi:hypothetical protein
VEGALGDPLALNGIPPLHADGLRLHWGCLAQSVGVALLCSLSALSSGVVAGGSGVCALAVCILGLSAIPSAPVF